VAEASRLTRILDYAQNIDGVERPVLRTAIQCLVALEGLKFDLNRHLSRFAISKSQFFVLSELFFEPGQALTPAELADRVVLTRATMTSCLDGLEKQGHVARLPHPTDRRMTLIRLTESGWDYIEGHLPEHYRTFCAIFNGLNEAEGRQLVKLLNLARDGARTLVGEPPL